jgi:hypothetical protein
VETRGAEAEGRSSEAPPTEVARRLATLLQSSSERSMRTASLLFTPREEGDGGALAELPERTWTSQGSRQGFKEVSTVSPHRPREDRLTHPADTSRSNLAAVLGLLSSPGARTVSPGARTVSPPIRAPAPHVATRARALACNHPAVSLISTFLIRLSV